jgi:putative hydrolase of the HAD superfamily
MLPGLAPWGLGLIPHSVRAVFFDAVGTLLHPVPPAPQVYATIGQRHGSRLTHPEVCERFRTAFAAEEALDCGNGLKTDERREKERWRRIVARVLDDISDPKRCFEELFDHFGTPHAWRCEPQTSPVLTTLTRRGLTLGLASNFDRRLRTVAHGLPELRGVSRLVISSEVGYRKPAPDFFLAVREAAALPPEQILFVGDDRANDFEGARAAGMHAVLYDPAGVESALGPRITQLRELLHLVNGAGGDEGFSDASEKR